MSAASRRSRWARRSTSSTPATRPRGTDAIWNPGLTTQDFTIAVVDKAGKEGVVAASSPRYGTALHQTTGVRPRPARTSCSTRSASRCRTSRPRASTFGNLRKLELRFGGAGKPATGSIQLSDVRFQEAAAGPTAYTDKLADVPPTALAPALAGRGRSSSPFGHGAGDASAPSGGKCATASASLASTRVVKRRLTLRGTTSACAASVRVTITRVGVEPPQHRGAGEARIREAGRPPRPSPRAATGHRRPPSRTAAGARRERARSRTKTVTCSPERLKARSSTRPLTAPAVEGGARAPRVRPPRSRPPRRVDRDALGRCWCPRRVRRVHAEVARRRRRSTERSPDR